MARVLLVEDNEQICDFLSRRLERRGHEILLAREGEAAIACARAGAPDVVLLEMDAPQVDGGLVANALKRDPQTSAIPIIALILENNSTDGETAIQVGADAFHAKPIDTTKLFEQIDTLLAARSGG